MTKRSRQRRAADFPVATIAPYGPDKTRATKLVVSILQRPGDREPRAMRTCTTEAADVRSDPSVAAEVAAFNSECRVKRTVKADRIIGCPHQEGVDYPLGRTCPQCPFWAGIDQWFLLLVFSEHDGAWSALRDRMRDRRRGMGFAQSDRKPS